MWFTLVIKNDNTRRNYLEQPVWKLHQTPCTWMCQLSSMGPLGTLNVVTLDTGSQSTEEVPFPTKRMGKHNTPRKAKSTMGRSDITDIIVIKEFDGQCDEIDVHFVGPYPDMVSGRWNHDWWPSKYPGKQKHIPLCTFQLIVIVRPMPLSQVKVNTRAGGNVMSLKVFERLYPKQMNLNGEPTGLEISITKLTAYNGMQIPQYGALRCPLIWNGAKPRCIQTKRYVADTPGCLFLRDWK